MVASTIIAFIMGEIVKENRECTHKEIVISNAVSSMTDYDLKNFMNMMENAITVLGGYEIVDISKLDKANEASYWCTLRLCANGGLFREESDLEGQDLDEEGYLSVYGGLHYLVLEEAHELMRYIEKVNKLLRY
jgi:hypothetical protein